MEVSKAALRWDCTFRLWLVLSNSNFPSYFGNIFEVRGDAFRTTTFETGNVETVGDGVLLELEVAGGATQFGRDPPLPCIAGNKGWIILPVGH